MYKTTHTLIFLSESFLYTGKLYIEKVVSGLCSQVKLSSLNLDDHARKKMIKLVGERYDKGSDILSIKADR